MKIALIPPVPELGTFGHGNFHLLLTHMMKDADYAFHYRQQKAQGAYLVLDNSAHEYKLGLPAERLLQAAWTLSADEIVAPDVLWDGPATLDRTTRALDFFAEGGEIQFSQLKPRVMLVPQGRDDRDYFSCLSGLVWKYSAMSLRRPDLFDRPPVIGVSKDYEVWWNGRGIQTIFEQRLAGIREANGVDVHLLGWSRNLRILEELRETYPWIRSTDSAKPFVYAASHLRLDLSPEVVLPDYPTRSDDYFTTQFDSIQREIAQHNVEVFRDAANGVS